MAFDKNLYLESCVLATEIFNRTIDVQYAVRYHIEPLVMVSVVSQFRRYSEGNFEMAFLSTDQLMEIGFRSLGKDVLVSDKASICNPETISIGDHSRVDDFCLLSGYVSIGRNVHIAVFCNVAGGSEGVFLEDFSGLAYGCHIFSQSDDYSGRTMTNPTVPSTYKNEKKDRVKIGRHCILGTCSIVFPGVEVAEGTAIGAMAVVTKTTEPWSIYAGNPARRIKDRKKDLLRLEQDYLAADREHH